MISNDKQTRCKEFSLSNKKFSTHRKVSDRGKKISSLCVASTVALYKPCFDTLDISIIIPLDKVQNAYELAKKLRNDTKQICGLSHVEVKKVESKNGIIYYFTFRLSSKWLGINYFYGFTIDNYDEVIKFCQLYLGDVFDETELTSDKIFVYSGDLKYDYCCSDAKKVIRNYRAILKYDSEHFDRITKKTNEVKFYNTNSTPTLRFHLLIYNKTKEFKLARNKCIRIDFDDAGAVFKTEIVRFELQIKSPIMLNRFLYGINSRKMHTLYDLLQPKPIVNPIYTVYKLIFSDIKSDSHYDTDWVKLMKNRGPMKFAEDIGVAVIPLFCDDDINKVKLAYKGAYSSNSSLSREKFSRLTKAIPSKKTLSDKYYRMIKNLVLRRLSNFYDTSTSSTSNLYDLVEHKLISAQNEVYSHLYVDKSDSFFAKTIRDYKNIINGPEF